MLPLQITFIKMALQFRKQMIHIQHWKKKKKTTNDGYGNLCLFWSTRIAAARRVGNSVEICSVKPTGTGMKSILYTHETPFAMAHISRYSTQNNGLFIRLRRAASPQTQRHARMVETNE